MFYLSYLMGASEIQNQELEDLNIEIVATSKSGSRSLKIPVRHLLDYIKLIKTKLTAGFWNEVVGSHKIIFIFKFKDGNIKEYVLSPDNEREISKLCSEFNGDALDKTANLYKYISENDFYHDFMLQNYGKMIS